MAWEDLFALLRSFIPPAIEVMDADVELSGYFGYWLTGLISHSDGFKLELSAVALSVFSCHWAPLWVS